MPIQVVLALCVIFGSVALIVWLLLFFGYKRRLAAHDTIRLAMEHGQEISSETIKVLTMAINPATADLRRGVILIATGFAIALFGGFVGFDDAEALAPMLGIACAPATVGIAYLGLWRFGHDREAG
ncbi:MAG: DUF6249 domain-containing protein [Pseudomonadota bacterium]